MKKIEQKCDFSYKHYEQILRLAKKLGYKFCFFSEQPDLKKRKIYLRHDIDFSMERALKLAEIENKNNIRSTFFIRVDSSFYNLFEPIYSNMVKQIFSFGHQIGLHFNEKCIKPKKITKKTIEKEIISQLKFFRKFLSHKNLVSFHCPSSFVLNKKFDSEKFISAYEPQFFSKIKYFSDSRSVWREGCICNFLNSLNPPQNFQLLTHGESWGTEGKNADSRLAVTLKEKIEQLDEVFAQESEAYQRGSFLKFF